MELDGNHIFFNFFFVLFIDLIFRFVLSLVLRRLRLPSVKNIPPVAVIGSTSENWLLNYFFAIKTTYLCI